MMSSRPGFRLRGACVTVAAAGALAGTLAIGAALAAPPADSDGHFSGWFQSLKQPGSGASCCSIADCRRRPYRSNRDGYEVLIESQWIEVPGDKILRVANPTGDAVVCAIGTRVLCFVPGPET